MIDQKALDGAGKSKKCKNIALARKLTAYTACQQQSSSVPIQHVSRED